MQYETTNNATDCGCDAHLEVVADPTFRWPAKILANASRELLILIVRTCEADLATALEDAAKARRQRDAAQAESIRLAVKLDEVSLIVNPPPAPKTADQSAKVCSDAVQSKPYHGIMPPPASKTADQSKPYHGKVAPVAGPVAYTDAEVRRMSAPPWGLTDTLASRPTICPDCDEPTNHKIWCPRAKAEPFGYDLA